MTTWFSATAVVPQLRDAWDLGQGQVIGLTLAVQIGFVLGAVGAAATNLADLVRPARLIAIGATGAGAANFLLLFTADASPAIALRLLTGVFLAGVYPPALKLMATWFRRGRGTALGPMVGALTLGSALPHLVNGAGGADWRLAIAITSALTLTGGIIALVLVPDGPLPFPRATFDPRQVTMVVRDRGVRLASLGYFGHIGHMCGARGSAANGSPMAAAAGFGAVGNLSRRRFGPVLHDCHRGGRSEVCGHSAHAAARGGLRSDRADHRAGAAGP